MVAPRLHAPCSQLVERLDEKAGRISALCHAAEEKGEEEFKRFLQNMVTFARGYGRLHVLASNKLFRERSTGVVHLLCNSLDEFRTIMLEPFFSAQDS